MAENARPQGTEEEEPKWPIDFNRQSLLTACWGSAKGADFLYHFLNKARWEIKNQKLAKSVKVIKFQEEKADILNALKKADRFISQGMYSTMLRNFNAVGYVISQPYGTSYEVHLDVIETAFKQPPQKPGRESKPEKQSRKVSKMTDRHNDTISRTEYNSLVEVCVKLTDKCQSLTKSVALLTSMCQSLTQNPSIYSALQADLPSSIWLQSNALEIEDDSEFFSAPESEHEQPTQSSTEEKKADDLPSQEGAKQLSYSQDTSTIRESGDENESHSQFGGCMAKLIAEFEANLAPYETRLFVVSSDTWLQENTETHVDTQPPSQEISVQTNIFGEALPEKPTVPASSRPPILVSTRLDVPEIRQKTAAQIAKERKEIERHIWKLLDDAAEARIGRAFTKPMEDLVTGIMDGAYVDEDFTFSVQDLKARGQGLTFSNIVNNMADAVIKRKAGQQPGKIIPFQQNQQQHKGSPTGYVMTSQQEQQVKDNLEPEMERRRARIAARKAQEAAMA